MTVLEMLRTKNPAIPIYDVNDPAFMPYGRIIALDDPEPLSQALTACPIPETGNRYVASEPGLENLAVTSRIRRLVYGEMPIEAGYCNGRGFKMNAMEYHRCSEVNFTTTGLVLLLALPGQIRNRVLDSSEVVGFYLPPQTAVEILPNVLHFAPCRVTPDGFNCLVVLERGTNEELDEVDTKADGEEAMLWKRNKWLLCHPESPQASNGAFVGITGENLTVFL
ncbi:MAG: DUF4867 family protein [Clostridia bacterium]|nr:DUF4867 family protein [Clostridia bacterium]